MRTAVRIMVMVCVFGACSVALAAGQVVWEVPSSLQRVGSTDAAGSGTTAVLHAARGEYVPFSDLMGPRGGVLSRTNFILYREWDVAVKQHSPTYNRPPNLPITNVQTFPDALIPLLDPATGKVDVDAKYRAATFDLVAGHNVVIWIDVFVPRGTAAREYQDIYTVTSDQESFKGQIRVHVWGFTLPLEPSLKSSFDGGVRTVPGVNEELLRKRIMPGTVDPADEKKFINRYGLNATVLGFFSGVSYGRCHASEPPSPKVIVSAKATHQPDLYLYDDSADPENSCTSPALYSAMIAWAQNLHRADVDNLVTQEPVAQLCDDGLGTGRSAVDIWTMLPLAYDDAQSFPPPRVTYALQKRDKVWSYNALVQDSYSPKWELDFLPINYRIQAGFISQSLGLTDSSTGARTTGPPTRGKTLKAGRTLISPGKGCWPIRVGPQASTLWLRRCGSNTCVTGSKTTKSRTTNICSCSRIVARQHLHWPRLKESALTGPIGRETKAGWNGFASNWEVRSPPAIAPADWRKKWQT